MANDGCDPLRAACLGRIFIDVGEENGSVCEYGQEPCQEREGIRKMAVGFWDDTATLEGGVEAAVGGELLFEKLAFPSRERVRGGGSLGVLGKLADMM